MAKITYGIEKVHYATITITDGEVTYGAPVPLPGASEMTLSPVGEEVKVYADNSVYVTLVSNQGYEGDLSLYTVPESFWTDIMGMRKDSGGALIESANDIIVPFALLGEFSTEEKIKKRWVLYNCTARRPDFAGKTKEDGAEAQLFALPITASPAEDTGDTKASIEGDPSGTVATFNSWFNSVFVKGAGA